MKFLFNRILWIVLTSVIALLFIVLIVATVVCNVNFNAVNMAFGSPLTSRPVQVDKDSDEAIYYKTSYDKKVNGALLLEKDQEIIEEVVGEAATLLWNNGALPLNKGAKISPFNKASADIVETGSGSGYIATNAKFSATLKSALEREGVDCKVNPSLWDFLKNANYNRTTRGGKCIEWERLDVNEIPWSRYTATALSEISEYRDAAIITISRTGGEYADHRNDANDTIRDGTYTAPSPSNQYGSYIQLTQQEVDTLQNVTNMKRAGQFSNVILLINSGNQLEFDQIAPFMADIDAAMWIGQPGMFGMNAVADLLVGNINPSGHLPDTWAYVNVSAPSTANDGPKFNGDTGSTYKGSSTGIGDDSTQKNRYMVYQEGIYVGYKYYETRYEDTVLGEGNATSAKGVVNGSGAWDYDDEVVFPFGHGESYTDFTYSGFSASKNSKGGYNVKVTVKNSGLVEGKDAVQIYLQKPYTQYAKDNTLEKSAVELVGYAKTKTLAAGESQTLTITVDEQELLTYDSNNKEHYILDGGDFYFTAGQNAHDAVNNILEAKGAGSVGGDASLTAKFTLKEDDKSYIYSRYNEDVEVTNQLDHGDINKYAGRGDNSVTYLSRSDWDATYPTEVAQLSYTEQLINDVQYGQATGSNGYTDDERFNVAPTYNKKYYKNTAAWIAEHGLMPQFDSFGNQVGFERDEKGELILDENGKPKLTLDSNGNSCFELDEAGNPIEQVWTVAFLMSNYKDIDFVENGTIDWDSDWWDIIIDQMSWDEQAALCANAYHRTEPCKSITLPETKEENGPVGITQRTEKDFGLPGGDKVSDWTWVSYPNGPLVGATFNTELVEREGQHKSEDMLYLGYSGIYGPGANLHRTAYGGRNWEYPSECEFLTGKTVSAETKGIQSKGAMAFVKHFALNDLEASRRHISTWSTEQASREIYLKAFEYAFTEGGALATMNSFTRVGPYWCGANSNLIRNILRDEWDFKGMNITDWDSGGTMNKYDAMLGGTDSWDGNGRASTFSAWRNDTKFNVCMREATKHMIYAIMHTNGMNGYSADTKLETILVWWQKMFIAFDVVSGVLAAGCAVMLTLSILRRKKEKKAKLAQSAETEDVSSSKDN